MRIIFFRFWPILFIVSLWFAFSSPFFIKGQIPFPGDYQVTFFPPWSQYPQFPKVVKNNATPDIIDQIYPWKYLVIESWKNGQVPLWNPYAFAGTPLLANYQSAAFTPLNILFFIFSFKQAWGFLILLQPLLTGIGMYFFIRKLSVSGFGALLSSFSFMFCGFITTWMGYGTLGYAISILPVILLGLEGFFQTKRSWYLLFVSLGLAFSFLSGHFQISLYVLFAVIAYAFFHMLQERKISLVATLAIVAGVLLASIQIFPTIAVYTSSLRSQIFQLPEVIPWKYFLTLIAPDFFGNPVTRNDWFGHYAEWSSYIGVLPVVFALFGILSIRKNRYVLFFVILGLLSLLFATYPFSNLLLFSHIPVLSTSAAGRIIVLVSFSLSVLGGIGLDAWMVSSKKKNLFLAGFALLLLCVGWVTILLHLGLPVDRVSIAKQNFILPSLLLLFAVIVSISSALITRRRILLVFVLSLLALTAFDMYRFASKWQPFTSPSLVFPDVGVTNFFKTIKNQRALGNYGGQLSLYYQIPAVEGYDALYPERFGEFVSFVADGKIHPASRSVVDFPKNAPYAVINFLGIQYIIQKISDIGKPWAFPVNDYPPEDFKIVYKDDQYIVFENKLASSRAYITGFYKVVSQKDILPTLFAPSTNPGTTVILEKNPGIPTVNSYVANDNTAKILSYTPNTVVISTQTTMKTLLFLSDTYFPGWHAYVDGKETEILRADYTFRAVVVPAGKHTVVFNYLPLSFIFGVAAAIIGILSLIFISFSYRRAG